MHKIAIAAALVTVLSGCGASREQLAQDDDATCQSYGAQPGSQAYIECRMRRDTTRTQGDNLRRAAILSQPDIPFVVPGQR
jgi:hypothetical protein